MDATLQMTLALLMRWTHILSVIVLVGSAYYVRRTRTGFAPGFRTTVFAAAALAFLSGLYNFLTKSAYPPGYHMWFGIKFLLAVHVLAALVLAANRGGAGEKLQRSLRIALLSATVAVAISGYLRWLMLNTPVRLP